MRTKTLGYGIGGFALSLLFSIAAALGLQFIFDSIWVRPESFLAIYGSTVVIAIAAVTLTWLCLLRVLKNKAMIRGVWFHIYGFALLSIIVLAVMLFA
jgi:hypothetical protein